MAGPPRKLQLLADAIGVPEAVIDNQDDWQRQHVWLVQDMKRIRDVFEPRLAKVGAFGGSP